MIQHVIHVTPGSAYHGNGEIMPKLETYAEKYRNLDAICVLQETGANTPAG